MSRPATTYASGGPGCALPLPSPALQRGADWLHVSGVTPALGQPAVDAAIVACLKPSVPGDANTADGDDVAALVRQERLDVRRRDAASWMR